jgi:hypothetical protein
VTALPALARLVPGGLPHPVHRAIGGHAGFGSFGVMLLAIGILLVGVAVLMATWRRRAGKVSPDPSDEQGA